MTLNLLPIAMSATAILGCNKQFEFYKYTGSKLDEMGRDVPDFAEPVIYTGSIQPVPNRMYEQLGLDLNKNYKTVYSPELMQSIAENIQPDRIVYNSKTFQIIDDKDWYETNGYTKIIMVEIKELRNNDSNTDTVQNEKSNI